MLEKAYLSTAFGCFEITGSNLGISRVRMVNKKPCPEPGVPEVLQNCVTQLKEYFAGERSTFDIKIDFGAATPFNKSVWEELIKIPYGHTTTYSAIAENIGNPPAVRAVGLANRNNPIAIIIPCHRCIAKSGELHGYFYGLDMKRRLLELENPMSFARQGSLF